MGYVGNAPAEKYTTIDKQTLTGNNTVGPYTLTHSVGNEQEIEVFVNNVRQEPGVSYTVSSNQLTMSASVASADDFYVIFQGKAKMTATHPPTFDLTAANGTFTGTVTTGGLTVGSDTAKTKFYSNSTYNGIYNGSALTNNESIYMGSGTLFFYSGGGERMRIDSSGNVGIGTTTNNQSSSTASVTLNAASGMSAYELRNADVFSGYVGHNGTNMYLVNAKNGSLGLYTNNAERLRIDSSGNLLVGTTDSNVGDNSGASNGGINIGTAGVKGVISAAAGQTVAYLNRLGSDGGIIDFRKDGTTVGSIGSFAGNSYFAGSGCGLRPRTGDISPTNASGSTNDGGVDLGTSSNRFNNILLSGGVYLGGTGSANQLHYYEEGAWTPALNGGLTPSIYQASFTAIGNRVFLTCNITVPTNSINAAIIVSGLPYSTLHDGSGALSYTNAQTTNDFFILVQGSQIYFYKGIGTTNYLLSDLSGYILRFTAQYNINN